MTGPASPRQVVVTGLGVVTAVGRGVDVLWDSLFAPVAPGPVRSLAFTARGQGPDAVGAAALVAFEEAQAAAHLQGGGPRTGVVLGTGLGGLHAWERAVLAHARGGSVTPRSSVASSPAAAAAAVAHALSATGPCRGVATACAAGTDAIADGAALIRMGRCDVVLVGGAEAAATATNVEGLRRSGALSPSGAGRPFDIRRDGLVLAEAAAALVLESAEHALGRGVSPLAEVAGWASTCDAGHASAPRPDGRELARCAEEAVADAGLVPAEVAAVDAHATGTRAGDAAEAAALTRMFGRGGVPPVIATKGATGHAMAAAGAVGAVVAVLALQRGELPPVAGLDSLDPSLGLDPASLGLGLPARPWAPGPVLSLSAGFGGFNAAVVLTPVSSR